VARGDGRVAVVSGALAPRRPWPPLKGPSHIARHIRNKTARDGRLSDGAEALYARSAVSYGSAIKKSGTKRLSCTGGVERKRQGACRHRHGRQCCVSSPIVPLARIKRIPTSAGWGPQRYIADPPILSSSTRNGSWRYGSCGTGHLLVKRSRKQLLSTNLRHPIGSPTATSVQNRDPSFS